VASKEKIRNSTIQDFGEQWKIHGELETGHWTSAEMLVDHFGDIFDLREIEGKTVVEVGSGSGRILNMLNVFGPKLLIAIEPSNTIDLLKLNTKKIERIEYQNTDGASFSADGVDYVFSIGVIQFIKDPQDVVRNIYDNLDNGGKFAMWVYGAENNRLYISLYKSISTITKIIPDGALNFLSYILNIVLTPYVLLCRYFKLPLHDYINNVFGKCSWKHRRYIVFDQLNPRYSKYYYKDEVIDLLSSAGFTNIKLHHRHGYSWTAVGEKSLSGKS